jgi:hypothetical protein
MTDSELERALQSVGKACFITHHGILSDLRMTREERGRRLKATAGYTENGTRTRVNNSEAIIAGGRTADAMAIMAGSIRTAPQAIAAAKKWLAERR